MKYLIVVVILLNGCTQGIPTQTTAERQKLRVELFNSCMERVPKAPLEMGESDWSRIVDACDKAAYYQSIR